MSVRFSDCLKRVQEQVCTTTGTVQAFSREIRIALDQVVRKEKDSNSELSSIEDDAVYSHLSMEQRIARQWKAKDELLGNTREFLSGCANDVKDNYKAMRVVQKANKMFKKEAKVEEEAESKAVKEVQKEVESDEHPEIVTI